MSQQDPNAPSFAGGNRPTPPMPRRMSRQVQQGTTQPASGLCGSGTSRQARTGHQPKNDPETRLNREQNDDQHVPAARKPLERIILGFHRCIAKIHRAGKGNHDDGQPSCPTWKQP
ncbi:hypothetical protein GQR58_000103 [Nymphon striatum]|nr:hypothetical protein GQR58_000103 [Nymphon striatum]